MDYEFGKFGPDLLDTLVRGVVALLGISSLSVVVFVLLELGTFLTREPQTAAEAHAMAHSVVGILVAGAIGVGGFGLAGAILLTTAYVNRHRVSAVTLVLTGLIGLLLAETWSYDSVFVASLLIATLGGYVLYEDITNSGLFEFTAGVTTLFWFVDFLLLLILTLGLPRQIVWFVPSLVIIWIRHLLGIGALGILAAAGWYRYRARSVSRAPVVLAAAILLAYLPGGVRAALVEYAIAGLTPIDWIRVIVASGAALTISAGSLERLVQRFRRLVDSRW